MSAKRISLEQIVDETLVENFAKCHPALAEVVQQIVQEGGTLEAIMLYFERGANIPDPAPGHLLRKANMKLGMRFYAKKLIAEREARKNAQA